MPLFVPACAYERNPATIEEKRVLCDAALASVLDLLVREQPRPADPLAWVAERLKEWEIQRLGARTAAREAIERVMPRIRAVGRWRGAGEEGKARRERRAVVDEMDGADPLLISDLDGPPVVGRSTSFDMVPASLKEFEGGSSKTKRLLQLASPEEAEAQSLTVEALAPSPLEWLQLIVSDALPLPLPPDVAAFLSQATAEYLDEFLDGGRPPTLYRSMAAEFTFYERLERAWAARHGPRLRAPPPPMPSIPPRCAVAQYVKHCVDKMSVLKNADLHLYRASAEQVERHHLKLAHALAAALERDFAPAQRALGGTVDLETDEVVEIMAELSRARLCSLYLTAMEARERSDALLEEACERQERLAHELWAWGVHIDEHPRTHRDKQRELLSRALGHARLRSGVVYR